MITEIYISAGGAEIECQAELELDYTPGREAKLSAIPEFCFPAEEEDVSLYSVKIDGVEVIELLSKEQILGIEIECLDKINEMQERAKEEAA